jgi:CHASE2 domain-containing sensor protein
MDYVSLFNACEALLWGLLAVFVAWRYGRVPSSFRRLSRIAAVLLALFGLSDVIEIHTGAWWRPWELLALKGICLCGLLACGWRAHRLRRRERLSDGSQGW